MIKEILKNIKEADGGYGDLGVVPTAPNPALRKRKEDECEDENANEKNCNKKKVKLKLKTS